MPRRIRRPRTEAEEREDILSRSGSGFCFLCWEAIYPWQDYNWDHVVPMSRGGARGKRNQRLTHTICNSVKGNEVDFFLRTEQQRQLVLDRCTERIRVRLQRAWNGVADQPELFVDHSSE